MTRQMVIALGASVVVSEILWQIYKIYIHPRVKRNRNRKPINECFFFREEAALCRAHVSSRRTCNRPDCPVPNFNKLLNYLSSAECTIHLCMYFFTCQEFAEAILKAQKRGVVVKMIVDGTMAENESSQIVSLRKTGIRVRLKRANNLMHHKFAIVDNDVLITGSANWTMQAFFGNFDNVIVTNQSALVKQYSNEFDKLWIRYDFNEEDNGIALNATTPHEEKKEKLVRRFSSTNHYET